MKRFDLRKKKEIKKKRNGGKGEEEKGDLAEVAVPEALDAVRAGDVARLDIISIFPKR